MRNTVVDSGDISQLTVQVDSKAEVHQSLKNPSLRRQISTSGLEIRPVFAKLRFWVCRTLEFFAWVFEKNQGFLKKSYVNWSRILRLVNRFWIFIGISNDSFIEITLRSFLLIFRFFCFKFCRILEFYSWVIEFFPWVLSFFFLSLFQNVEFLSLF